MIRITGFMILGAAALLLGFMLFPIVVLWIVAFGSVIVAYKMDRKWILSAVEWGRSFFNDPVEDIYEYNMEPPMAHDEDDKMPDFLQGLVPALDEEARYAALPMMLRNLVDEGHSIIEIELNQDQALQLADDIERGLETRTSPAG